MTTGVQRPRVEGGPAPSGADGADRAGAARVGLATAGLVAAVALPVLLLLLTGGVPADQAARVTLVVVVQWAAGALLWRLARGPVPTTVPELIGAGLALGTLTALLGAQVLRPVGLGEVGWLVPGALLLLSLALPGVRRRVRAGRTARPTVDEAAGLLGAVALGLVSVRYFWRVHPLAWDGWWEYYVDIPHHEALATSLATWGPGDNILLAGEPIRYHWFSHAWAGALTDAASAGSFVAVTRALPVVALLGTVCLVWAWARRLSDRRVVPPLALLLTVLAGTVATGRQFAFSELALVSPSLGLGALWFLGAALVLTEHLRGRLAGGLPLLALLAVGCMGGKTSYAVVLAGGVGLVALASLRQPALRVRAWTALAVVGVALAAAFAALVLGSTGNLRLEAGASAAIFGVLPDSTPWGVVVGTGAAVLALAAGWAGLAALVTHRSPAGRPEVWFAAGAGGTGLLLAAALGHPGSSQLYFPLSAGVAVGVVSAWGVAEAWDRVHRGWVAAAVVAGGVAGVLGTVGVPGLPIWAGPYVVWLLPLLLALAALTAGAGRRRSGRPAGAVAVLVSGLVAAAVLAGMAGVVDTVRAEPRGPAAAGAQGAWTPSHEDALRWLRENSARDDVVATNRQCVLPVPAGIPCLRYRWFLTAALGHRRTYVEGADYAVGMPMPERVAARVERSRRFAEAPTPADARTLWDAGVRWVVVDLAATRTRTWTPYAEEAFATPTTVVLRLARP